jgi:arsenate reductase
LTCSQADGACPLLLVLKKNPNHFEDPKAFDNTPQQEEKYERSVRYGAFLCILKIKKIICQLIALLP